jgi:uncharacterized protein (UPF0332 family)
MTQDEARARNVEYLMLNAEQSLESAKAEAAASRHRFAMNRVYYACFYAASAVLVSRGLHFVKHAGLRAAVHRDLVKTGAVSPEMGAFFDEVFQDRQDADYGAFVEFDPAVVRAGIGQAAVFVADMKRLLGERSRNPPVPPR